MGRPVTLDRLDPFFGASFLHYLFQVATKWLRQDMEGMEDADDGGHGGRRHGISHRDAKCDRNVCYRADWDPEATSRKCMAGVPGVFWTI